MVSLDRELTEKLFALTEEDKDTWYSKLGEPDLITASRIAIDEVLAKLYNTKCQLGKESAAKMLTSLAKGEEVPEGLVATTSNQPIISEDKTILPEERNNLIIDKCNQLLISRVSSKDPLLRFNTAKRDPLLRSLGISEDDFKTLFINNEHIVCGVDSSSKAYLMVRNQEEMDRISAEWGDTYITA